MEYQIEDPEDNQLEDTKSNETVTNQDGSPIDFSTRWTAIPGEESEGLTTEPEEEAEVDEAIKGENPLKHRKIYFYFIKNLKMRTYEIN
jgi:hypothetical protein